MNTKIFLSFLFLILLLNFGFSQKKEATNEININGVWEDINTGVQNAVAIISEQNGKVIFSHYLEWRGKNS